MLEEWVASGEKIVPYAIRATDYHKFEQYMDCLEVKDSSGGLVLSSTFFCLDTDRNIIVGAVNIRRVLMVCDKSNIGSAKSILYNGGKLENEVMVDGIIEQRYWIDLSFGVSCS